MRFELEQWFTGPIDAVEQAFVDPALLANLATLPHLGRPELLEQTCVDHAVRQRVRYTFTARLSPAVTAVIDPNRLSWVEETELDRRTHRTELRIVPDHYPDRLSCEGTVTLRETADGRVLRVTDADLEVRAPLVARRAERAIISGLHQHAAAEETLVQEWLDARA